MTDISAALELARGIVSSERSMLEVILDQERVLIDRGAPRITPWWREQIEAVYASKCQKFVGEVGRRGGKSTNACRIAVAECTGRDWPIPFGDRGIFGIVSAALPQARRRLKTCGQYLEALGIPFTPTADVITLLDRPIDIAVYACNAIAVLGDTWIGCCFDEMAKWKDKAGGANPAGEVIASARPSLSSMRRHGAREWWISSPWAEMGEHYTAVEIGTTDDQVVGKAPTWVANPDIFTEASTHREEPDDLKWSREYASIPMPRVMVGMLDSRQLNWLDAQPVDELGDFIVAGADLGLRQDSSTLIAANRRLSHYLVRLVKEWRPEKGRPLVPSVICSEIASNLKEHSACAVMADQHYRESLREPINKAGLILLDAPMVPADPITRLRALMQQGLVSVYCPEPELRARLCAQIDSVQLVPTTTGLRVVYPREDGAHGDLVASLALCCWQQSGILAPVKAPQLSERALYIKRIAKEGRKTKKGRGSGTARSFRFGGWKGRRN